MTGPVTLTVTIGVTDDGRWLAATSESPYFCVEAKTRPEVEATAARAMLFYQRVLAKHGTVRQWAR